MDFFLKTHRYIGHIEKLCVLCTYVFLKNLRYYWNMNAINIFLYKSV